MAGPGRFPPALDEFEIRPEDLLAAVTPKTKTLVLSYPNNPTGAVMTRQDLEEIADVVVEKDLLVVSDEIDRKLSYRGKHSSFAQLEGMQDRTVILNGSSKSHAMTGWRIGYALGLRPHYLGHDQGPPVHHALCSGHGPGSGPGGPPQGQGRDAQDGGASTTLGEGSLFRA